MKQEKRMLGMALTAALAVSGCGGGDNVQPDPPTPRPSAPAPGPPTPRTPAPEPDPPTPRTPAPEPAPRTERSTPRIPGPGDYQPVEGAAAFRNDPQYRGSQVLFGELNANWALDQVRAADAYARLDGAPPGHGIRISVVDDGGPDFFASGSIYSGNSAFRDAGTEGRITTRGIFGGDSKGDHGTAVTSLILADNDRHGLGGFHGIAYGAQVDIYGIPLGDPPPPDEPYDPLRENLEDLIRGGANRTQQFLTAATEHAPNIVNMSFGYEEMAEQYLPAPARQQIERGIRGLIEWVKNQRGRIFVTSAGNANGRPCARRTDAGCRTGTLAATSPSFDSALPLWDASGEVGKRWVAVVATDRENAIADFSNRCGHAAKWCLAAPGVDVVVVVGASFLNFAAYDTRSGTSFAAPLVSGGLAVVKQRFGDTLTMEEVLARVYATADKAPDTVPDGSICPAHLDTDGDRSDCELSSTHGQGLMNLERATRPVGATTGHGRLVDAAGGVIADGLAGVEPVVFDSLGYPFRQPLEAQVTISAAAPDRIPSFTAGAEAGRPSWAGLHWREAARPPEAVMGSWAFAAATGGDGAVHSAGLAYAPPGGTWEAGWLAERDRVFGGRAEGTWAARGFFHHTGFLRLRKGWTLAGAEAAGLGVEWSSTVAYARMRGSGVLRETRGLYTGHRFEVARAAGSARTAFSIETPLRAETGTARLKAPIGGTLHTGVRYAERTASLAPPARELRLGANHQVEGRYGRLAIGAQLRLNAGHRHDGRDWLAGARWGMDF